MRPTFCKASAFHGITMRHQTNFRGFALGFTNAATHLFGGGLTYLRRCVGFFAHKRRLSFAILLALVLFSPAWAQDPPAQDRTASLFALPSRQHLFGEWGGERTALAERGITFDFFYITDLQANPTGGLQQAQAGWER